MILRVLALHFGGAPYLAASRFVNAKYCASHGLDFVVADRLRQGKRDALWSKVTLAKRHLAGCDALLYLDGDAVFVDHERGPETLTVLLPIDRSMLIGEDFTPGVANTGTWLIRNDEAGRAILDTWEAAPTADKTLCSRWPLDEAGFNEQVMPAHRGSIELMPRRALDLVDGDFIKHPCGLAITAKTDFLTRIAERYGL